jgi:peptidoglycan/LPS O-acetylase OafA/YrhL
VLLFLLFSTWRTHSRWLVRIGAISYSLYLLHPTVIGLLQHFQHGNPWGVGHLFVLEVAIFSIAAAAVCYICVEKPGIALGQRVRSALHA